MSEFVLKPSTRVFVCGMIFKKNGRLVLKESEEYPLIISKKTRDNYVHEFYSGDNLIYFSHFLLMIGFTLSLWALQSFLKINPFIFYFFLFIVNALIFVSFIVTVYNRIVTLKNRALNAFFNIKGEIKRRADLIPNIVEAVKGYVKHEREIQKIIAESRAEIFFSKKIESHQKNFSPYLIAVIENYPQLQASSHFQNLMKILIDTEERIAWSREFYNRTVRKYNTLIGQIPFSLVALIFKMKEMDFISINRG